jgi:hypothetical protein
MDQLPSISITRRGETVKLADGRTYPRPTSADYRLEAALTRRQEALFSRLLNLPNTEQGHGEAERIKRTVAKLEHQKHPLLKVWNKHLAPEPLIGPNSIARETTVYS